MNSPNLVLSDVETQLLNLHYVSFRVLPQEYKKDRIPYIRDLTEIVSTCRVSIRGWDMPLFDAKILTPLEDSVCSGFSQGRYVEAWRVYKSCQFDFIELCTEEDQDFQAKLKDNGRDYGGVTFFLSWINVIYSFCEYFEFAKRYAVRAQLSEGIIVEVNYRNMLNVGLSTDEIGRAHV